MNPQTVAVVYARETLPPRTTPTIFLMGPTPRGERGVSWRPEAIRLLNDAGFTGAVLSPEQRPDPDGVVRFRGDYLDQIGWEDDALHQASVILAYVPRDMATMPALTTNVEWGVWQNSGKIVLGAPAGADNNRYLEHYAALLGVPTSQTLPGTVAHALDMLDRNAPRAGCVFCGIALTDPRGQVEARYPDSVVITPLGPVVPGHRLVIPYRHVDSAVSDPRVTAAVMRDAATHAQSLDGDLNIITSVGPDATQTVFHLHVHLVPRVANDGLHLPWTGQAKEQVKTPHSTSGTTVVPEPANRADEMALRTRR